ncbi:MAG: hypothetical protein WEB58_14190 [Planctomycetaceae bacterium]
MTEFTFKSSRWFCSEGRRSDDITSCSDNGLREADALACTPACTNNDPELTRIIAAWPQLTLKLRSALLAMIDAVGGAS